MSVAREDTRVVLGDIIRKSEHNRAVIEQEGGTLLNRTRVLNFLGIVIGILLGGGIAGIPADGRLVQVGGPLLGFASALCSTYLFVFNLNSRVNKAFDKAKRYYESEAEARWFLLQLGASPSELSSKEQDELKKIYYTHYRIAKDFSGQYADLVGSTASLTPRHG